MTRSRHAVVVGIFGTVLLAGLLVGCKKTAPPGPPPPPPPLALRPLQQARADLIFQVVLPSLDRSARTIGQVAQKLGLPLSEADMRKTVLARAQLPAAAVDKVDLNRPVAAVVLLKSGTPAPAGAPTDARPAAAAGSAEPVLSWALKTVTPQGFDAFVATLGPVAKRDQDAVMLNRADAGANKQWWMLLRNGAVCAAATRELLVAGCALALEARKLPAEDLGAVIIPEGIARANGTTVAEALAKAKQQVTAQQAQAAAMAAGSGSKASKPDPAAQAAMMKLSEAATGYILDLVGDVSEARVLLSLDAAKGFGLTMEGVPKPGSTLVQRIASKKPYTIDPALLAGDVPGVLMAMGDLDFYRDMMKAMQPAMLEAAANDKERTALGAAIDTFMASLAGPTSLRFGFGSAPAGGKASKASKLDYRYDLVYALAPNVDAKKLLAALATVSAGAWLQRMLESGPAGLKTKVASRQDREGLTIRVTVDTRRAPPEMKKAWKAVPFLDGRPVEARAVVEGDRLLMSMGPDPKAGIAALRKPPEGATPPAGDIAAAMAETQGAESLFYSDLAALLRPFLAGMSGMPELAGPQGAQMLEQINAIIAPLRLGTWASHKGGAALTWRWRVPMTTMESAGTAVRGFMGLKGGGGPSAGGPGAP